MGFIGPSIKCVELSRIGLNQRSLIHNMYNLGFFRNME